jgi:uncharacterized protein YdiU (UPF0061 family)
MDQYHRETVYSSIDHMGRYAYGNQPPIAFWNLRGLANTLLPVIADDPEDAVEPATEVLQTFPERFQHFYIEGLRRKLGFSEWRESDDELAQDLLTRMADNRADFTLTFRRLSELGNAPSEADARVNTLFEEPLAFDDWAARWRERLSTDPKSELERQADMRSINPAFIPRNHRVEEVIRAAVNGDLKPFETLLEVLASPYDDQPDRQEYENPPRPEEVVHQTFCGT